MWSELWSERQSLWNPVSQSAVLGLAAFTSPRDRLGMQIINPIPELLDQKLLKWGPAVCSLRSSLGDYETPQIWEPPC